MQITKLTGPLAATLLFLAPSPAHCDTTTPDAQAKTVAAANAAIATGEKVTDEVLAPGKPGKHRHGKADAAPAGPQFPIPAGADAPRYRHSRHRCGAV